MNPPGAPHIAIACGGTGGHLFPGQAVADQLRRRGCSVTLLVSAKDVDQQAIKGASGLEWATLPAVACHPGQRLAFVRGFVQSYRAAARLFRTNPPQAVLAMGGFTAAPPVLAGRFFGARTFLHESNTIPGRANRWLAWTADQIFIGFPQAADSFRRRAVTVTGTPVRAQFQPRDPVVCRVALGLEPDRPVLLVMGGSQGATGINELVTQAVPLLARSMPNLQLFHLTGPQDLEKVRRACAAHKVKAVAHPFFAEMDLALGAATVAVSRAGASSLAEMAAMRIPAVLIPYPSAADNHQFHNARAFAVTGAARMLDQKSATPEKLAAEVLALLQDAPAREQAQRSLAQWHTPDAASRIANAMLGAICRAAEAPAAAATPGAPRTPRSPAPEQQHCIAV